MTKGQVRTAILGAVSLFWFAVIAVVVTVAQATENEQYQDEPKTPEITAPGEPSNGNTQGETPDEPSNGNTTGSTQPDEQGGETVVKTADPKVRVTFFCLTTQDGPIGLNEQRTEFTAESFSSGSFVFRFRNEGDVPTSFSTNKGGFSGFLNPGESVFLSTSSAVAGVSVSTGAGDNQYRGTASTNTSGCKYADENGGTTTDPGTTNPPDNGGTTDAPDNGGTTSSPDEPTNGGGTTDKPDNGGGTTDKPDEPDNGDTNGGDKPDNGNTNDGDELTDDNDTPGNQGPGNTENPDAGDKPEVPVVVVSDGPPAIIVVEVDGSPVNLEVPDFDGSGDVSRDEMQAVAQSFVILSRGGSVEDARVEAGKYVEDADRAVSVAESASMDALPETSGPSLILPLGALLVGSGILTATLLRRRG